MRHFQLIVCYTGGQSCVMVSHDDAHFNSTKRLDSGLRTKPTNTVFRRKPPAISQAAVLLPLSFLYSRETIAPYRYPNSRKEARPLKVIRDRPRRLRPSFLLSRSQSLPCGDRTAGLKSRSNIYDGLSFG